MKHYPVAERYARALSESIADAGELETALAALEDFQGLYAETPDLRSAFSNPGVSVEKRATLLQEVLAGEDMPDAVRHLLDILVRRGRIALLADVTEVFSTLVDRRLNRIGARVRTATPLSEAQRARLVQVLENYFKKSIRMKCVVDPTILGGVVARVGGVVLDGSVRSRLERLRAELLSREQ